MPKRPADPNAIESWKVFLRNHRQGIERSEGFWRITVVLLLLEVRILAIEGWNYLETAFCAPSLPG